MQVLTRKGGVLKANSSAFTGWCLTDLLGRFLHKSFQKTCDLIPPKVQVQISSRQNVGPPGAELAAGGSGGGRRGEDAPGPGGRTIIVVTVTAARRRETSPPRWHSRRRPARRRDARRRRPPLPPPSPPSCPRPSTTIRRAMLRFGHSRAVVVAVVAA